MGDLFEKLLSAESLRAATNEFCSAYPQRTAGSTGEERAANGAAELFRDAGLDGVTVAPVEFSVASATAWALADGGGRPLAARPLMGIAGIAERELPVVDVGLGCEEDYVRLRAAGVPLEGAAHLAHRGGNGPGTDECDRFEKVHHAKANGAAAVLYAMDAVTAPAEWLPDGADVPPPLEGGLGDLSPTIPAFVLAAREAEGITRIRIAAEVSEPAMTSWLVTGTLRGATDEDVVLGAQLDAVESARYGAPYDNGAGIAAVALLARALARAGTLRRSLTVCAFGAEEPGTFASRSLAADRMDDGRTVAMVNLDSWTHRDGWLGLSSYAGGSFGEGDFSRGAPFGGFPDTSDDGSLARKLAAKLEEAGYPADRTYLTRRAEWTSDHYPFAMVGIPAVWAFKKPVLFHCEYDTMPAMDWTDASLIARAHGLLLEDLLST